MYNVNWFSFGKIFCVFHRMKNLKKQSSNIKQKPSQNTVLGTNTKALETMVRINEITLERKSNKI